MNVMDSLKGSLERPTRLCDSTMFVTCLVSFYLTVFQIFYRYVTVIEDRRSKIEDRRPKIEDRRPKTEATRGRPSNNSVIISIILSLKIFTLRDYFS